MRNNHNYNNSNGNTNINVGSRSNMKKTRPPRPASSTTSCTSQQQQQHHQQQQCRQIMTLMLSLLLRTVIPLLAACIYMVAQFSSTSKYRSVAFQNMRASSGVSLSSSSSSSSVIIGGSSTSSSNDNHNHQHHHTFYDYPPHHHVPRQRQRQQQGQQQLVHNTVWNNVQYRTGVFGGRSNNNNNNNNLSAAEQQQQQEEEERVIREQCHKLAAYHYLHFDFPVGNHTDDVCRGPLPTNTTCCYCYFSDETFSNMEQYRTWACAVERNHSLLPFNATRIIHNNNNDNNNNNIDDDDDDDDKNNKKTKKKNNNNNNKMKRGPKIAWITGRFGHDDPFEEEVKSLCDNVLQNNYMDPQDVHCLWQSPDYALQNPKFTQRHLQFRNDSDDVSAKGGGFWFHKSVMLQHYMNYKYHDGDLIIYTDTDRVDFFDLATYNAVMDTMMQRKDDDLCMEVIGITRELKYTKEDMLTAFHATPEMRQSGQSLANVIVFRNSPKMRQFIDAWVDCMADWHMVSDEPSILPNGPGFRDHRHDQSVISLLVKTFMTPSSVVGPPARPYAFHCELFTYRFRKDDNNDHARHPITCPFAAYYASPEYAASLMTRASKNVTSNINATSESPTTD